MAFPKKQNAFDWLTQCWNILLGQRIDKTKDQWLLDPIGVANETPDAFISRIAREEGLTVESENQNAGLLDSLNDWPFSVHEKIEQFYTQTSCYKLSTVTQWNPIFGSFGFLVSKIFSRRIQQLNIPQGLENVECTFGNQIIKLTGKNSGEQYTIWKRYRQDNNEVVFYGIYSTCRIPSGELCVKASFPLPNGNATVIFQPQNEDRKSLTLISSGKSHGDPGFYFIVEDNKGTIWKHYLPSMREKIQIIVDNNGILNAEHSLKLWGISVYRMRYQMDESDASPTP